MEGEPVGQRRGNDGRPRCKLPLQLPDGGGVVVGLLGRVRAVHFEPHRQILLGGERRLDRRQPRELHPE